MNSINFCPECGKSFAASSIRCTCGWRKSKEEAHPEINDYGCQYEFNHRRCPLVGVICANPFGKKWFCAEHWRLHGDKKKSEEFLTYAENHIHELLKLRQQARIRR